MARAGDHLLSVHNLPPASSSSYLSHLTQTEISNVQSSPMASSGPRLTGSLKAVLDQQRPHHAPEGRPCPGLQVLQICHLFSPQPKGNKDLFSAPSLTFRVSHYCQDNEWACLPLSTRPPAHSIIPNQCLNQKLPAHKELHGQEHWFVVPSTLKPCLLPALSQAGPE